MSRVDRLSGPGSPKGPLPPTLQFYYITFFKFCQGGDRRASPADLLSVFPTEVFGARQNRAIFQVPIPKQVFLSLLSNFIISHFAMFCQVPVGRAGCRDRRIKKTRPAQRFAKCFTFGKSIRSGEARTFHEKNRIWDTRPENRPWRPGAAGRVSLG